MKTRILFMVIFASLFISFTSQVLIAQISADVLSWGNSSTVEYKYTKTTTPLNDSSKTNIIWSDSNNNSLLEEEHIYHNNELKRSSLKLNQLNKNFSCVFNKDKIIFSYDDEVKEESNDDNTIMLDQLDDFIRDNWQALMSDEDVEINMIDIEHQNIVGMNISNEGDLSIDGKECVKFNIDIRSFFTGIFVSVFYPNFRPLELIFETDNNRRLLIFKSLLHLRKKDGDNWENFAGELHFKYEQETFNRGEI